ncbi:MAG: UDP-N-acetylmuramoyl-L-alanine--D-glutamate ligase [Candidatus Berkelbacteria bacterium]|nr:UDP-N-acetylmuramoyl-L-alanine--D-glutamate ligase [Candidatus Berkelbacteria bacterium]
MKLDDLKNKNVAILGLAVEGLALVQFLDGKVGSLSICDRLSKKELREKSVSELRDEIIKVLDSSGYNFITGSNYLDNLAQFDVVFRSPGIYSNDPSLLAAKADGVEICSQMKLFFDLCPCPIIGVTGTKGKGTTASLISEILSEELRAQNSEFSIYLAGNIGKPAITLIPELREGDIVVLELSNFQLADLGQSPHIAVVTNLGVDHLDYHQTLEEYKEAKSQILIHQKEGDIAVLNMNSTFSDEIIDKLLSSRYYFSKNENGADAFVRSESGDLKVIVRMLGQEEEICSLREISLIGRHNLENIAAASIVAKILDVPTPLIREVVRDFQGLPHRLEKVDEIDGVLFVDDSFATNPGPTIAAIESFSQDKIMILGGSEKGADFKELAEVISKNNVKAVILIGIEASRIKIALQSAGFGGEIIFGGENIDEIVQKAARSAKSSDVVILSPACASFDMFKNYKDRGDKFKEAVLNLNSRSGN